jgi:hypothetical protein
LDPSQLGYWATRSSCQCSSAAVQQRSSAAVREHLQERYSAQKIAFICFKMTSLNQPPT